MPTVVIGLRGVVRLRAAGRNVIDLQPGDAAVIAAGAWHEHEPLRRSAAALALGFDYGMCDLLLSNAETTVPAVLPQQPAWQVVERLLAGDERAMSDLLALVLEVPWRDVPHLPAAVERMRDHIRSHGLTPITAADLARISGLGPSRAWELFREHFGCTPRQALERRRCAVAAALLDHGLAVSEVASRCGFVDRGTFTRAFARIQGVGPAAWRKRERRSPKA